MPEVAEKYTTAQGATDWLKGIVGQIVDTGSQIAVAKITADSNAKAATTAAEAARATALANAQQTAAQTAATTAATQTAASSNMQKYLLIGGGVLVVGLFAVLLLRRPAK